MNPKCLWNTGQVCTQRIHTSHTLGLHFRPFGSICSDSYKAPTLRLKNKRKKRELATYAGCQWWRWSLCHWGPPCWRPCRWSADPSRCWKATGRGCSRCFPSCRPGARSARSHKEGSRVERRGVNPENLGMKRWGPIAVSQPWISSSITTKIVGKNKTVHSQVHSAD